MSYARCGEDFDIYVYRSIDGKYVVNFCNGKEKVRKIMKENNLSDFTCYGILTLVEFLQNIQKVGILVPVHVFIRLEEEWKERMVK